MKLNPARPLWALLLGAGTLLAAGTANGQFAWEMAPKVALGAIYEDNPRLRPSTANIESSKGAILDAELRMVAYTERTTLSLLPRLRSKRYTGSSNQDLENDDRFLTFGARHQLQRSSLGLTMNYQEIGLRGDEFIGDTGDLERVENEQRIWSVNPSWSLTLTPRNRLELFGGYTDVAYRRSGGASRGNYEYISGGARLEHVIDERNRVSLGLNASRFEAGRTNLILENESDTYGASVTYERTLSELWTASLRTGATRTSSSTVVNDFFYCVFLRGVFPPPCQVSSSATNFVGTGELRRRGELTTVTLTMSRAITPNATGTEVVRDNLRLWVDREVTRRVGGSIGLFLFEEESVGPIATRDRRYLRAETIGRWRLAREWFARASYVYTRDKDDLLSSGIARDNHRVFLGVEYRGLGIRSR